MTKITWGKQKETFVLQLLFVRSAMNTDHKFIMTSHHVNKYWGNQITQKTKL